MAKFYVFSINTVFVGEHPGDFGFCGGGDDFRLCLRRCRNRQGNDEYILAAKGADDTRVVIIADLSGVDTLRRSASAIGTGDSRYGMFARFKKGLGKVFTNGAAKLSMLASRR